MLEGVVMLVASRLMLVRCIMSKLIKVMLLLLQILLWPLLVDSKSASRKDKAGPPRDCLPFVAVGTKAFPGLTGSAAAAARKEAIQLSPLNFDEFVLWSECLRNVSADFRVSGTAAAAATTGMLAFTLVAADCSR